MSGERGDLLARLRELGGPAAALVALGVALAVIAVALGVALAIVALAVASGWFGAALLAVLTYYLRGRRERD